MSVTLNVIYTPGTVERLSFFAWSLLRWPGVELRLVANGCSHEERGLLKELAGRERRLSYMELPSATMWLHGEALDYLLTATDEKIFGFIDSDIFAIEPAAPPTMPDDCVAAFGCPKPVWRPVALPKLAGCTYMALYQRDVVTTLRDASNISFNKTRWENIPPAVQHEVEAAGLRVARYDTGQLLNAVLFARGYKTAVIDSQHLRHIGQNSNMARPSGPMGEKRSVSWWLRRVRRREMRLLWRELIWLRGKRSANLYLNEMMDAVINGQQLPSVPWYLPRRIRRQVNAITMDIVTIYAEYQRSPVYIRAELVAAQ